MTDTAAPAPARRSLDPLTEAWSNPPGVLGWLSAVNHKQIGLRFVVTGFLFFVVGGVLALLMRTQLAAPENDFVSAQGYNELFTAHGTTMMFLFAVPVLEGLGMYFLPLMLGTRDLPFPRLNAFGYWAYVFGGLLFYASILTNEEPDGGWFAYPPLTDPVFSPGRELDFWLLGVTFVEISAIVGAVELIVLFFTRRAPGMALNRIPLFAWAVVVMAFMIVFAFPALVTGSVLLEVDRAFGTHFFNPAGGGDPLLWQHLFWFFGHPEVYIMLLPATGIVSMVVPVFARRPIAGYSFIVAALVAIGVVSFGLWIHHMFAVGLPLLALSIFAAASFLIVIPSGVQVFAWLVTLWRGRPVFRTPLLFVLGFLVIFVLGGITGVMVAAVPFDWQVHDTFFVVAHFHYVLVGGVVFPIFAGLYYWFPKWSGRLLSEGLGQLSFWTMFVGFNVAFFPQHVLGLGGMPRRVATYSAAEGWGTNNLISTIGAYVLGAGMLLTALNVVLALVRGRGSSNDPWEAGSLEWLAASPPEPFNFRTLPVVASADPLWGEAPVDVEDERLVRALRELERAPGGVRETLETTAVAADPVCVVRLPGPSLTPFGAALGLLVALIGALLNRGPLLLAGTVVAIVLLVAWGAGTAAEAAKAEDGRDRALPVRAAGAGWWGLFVGLFSLLVVLASLLFGYYLLMAKADVWPLGGTDAPPLIAPVVAAVLALAAAGLAWLATRLVREARRAGTLAALAAALVLGALFGAAVAFALDDVGVGPLDDAYGSIVFAVLLFNILLAVALVLILGAVVWQTARGLLDAERHVSVGVAALFAAFVALSWPLTLATVFLAPRVV